MTLINDAGLRWVVVHIDVGDPIVRRYPVPGGWIYQVSADVPGSRDEKIEPRNWHPPIFVPNTGVSQDD